uniref:Bromodomain and WD repeat-containing protein 3 n=1 Tax=Elaeis guineensis var. tenera TaxID=51953 RepID=A0A6I9S797_ELAGV|nr:bromodomain and WD repeat-containing protein 3 [Elaeis guineensis]
MALRKYKPAGDASSASMASLNFKKKVLEKVSPVEPDMTASLPTEADVDIDLREVYFLIMHFLSAGPCNRTYGQFWNELLEHQLLPRRYHAWYSRSGLRSGDEDDDGVSLPLCYLKLAERYPHVGKDHLVKLLKQLILNSSHQLHGMVGGGPPNAADVPTLLGSGSFSLLGSDRDKEDKGTDKLPGYLRWPHMQADQVHGLSLREIGGGFTKHHRAPSVRAACYAIAKPLTLVQKMQIIKKLRGHQNAVYCATFDRSGRYVITGSDDRLVKIWSMETAFCLASCRGHEGDITDLAVSSNNALVASSSNDFIIRVWRLPDGLPISVLRGHTGAVTAIAFSPRPSAVYQLLSSSDDGTCRIWDARNSHLSPRIYIPKPSDNSAGKSSDPSPSTGQQSHQILCCAFNANGTVFVTGSSDTYARVWNACKSNTDDSEQPNHEMDLLSGHENDVNYVQFSGCVVASRSCTADILKEDNIPKFKNSWFTHDNIVTCSRDGSAIIWIPRSRRSHGKVGRWTRAYHLKVPPPPMPPQPPRGGPRQRFQPTPRGVNMIVWSLDNRFVLAAIMDCRICVWNASDGSLVHSLIGHSESTFVLDVHPFNPRIAMSAGYDGKTIIWDIWEGTPVRIYETGRFKLVDGKFSPDGTSIVLSDEVGQIFIIATGQGESQKDAKYDQFFLGDYRPLIQDTNGNVLDQETQLLAYRRNIQDLLCDSSMIPYPEPYQNMYQQRRLGTLGIEWRPTSVNFAVGPTYNVDTGDYQMLPIVDLDRWAEPLPEFVDAIDWEPENEVQSDDTDSEYNVTDEYSSEGEHECLSSSSSGEPVCSAGDSGDHNNEGLRRSRRKKHKSEAEFTTSSGRRVKRRNLDEHDGTTLLRTHRPRRSRSGRLASRRKSSKSKSLRPQRRAARNALNLFSKITGVSTDGEDEDDSESSSSESESVLPDSNTQSMESDKSMPNNQIKHAREKEVSRVEREDVAKPSALIESQANVGSKRRLVLKLPRRDQKAVLSSEKTRLECTEQDVLVDPLTKANTDVANPNRTREPALISGNTAGDIRETGQTEKSDQPNLSAVYEGRTIKWGEVKLRSSKRLRLGDASVTDPWLASNACPDGPNMVGSDTNGHLKSGDEYGRSSSSRIQAHGNSIGRTRYRDKAQVENAVSQGLDGARLEELSSDSKGKSSVLLQSSPCIDQENKVTIRVMCNGNRTEPATHMDEECQDSPQNSESRGIAVHLEGSGVGNDNKNGYMFSSKNSADHDQVAKNAHPSYPKVRIKSRELAKETSSSSSKLKSVAVEDLRSSEYELMSNSPTTNEQNGASVVCEEDEGTSGQDPEHGIWNNGSESLETSANQNVEPSNSHDSTKLHAESYSKKYNAVYKRSKSSRGRKNSNSGFHGMDESTSNWNNPGGNMKVDLSDAMADGIRQRRSMGTRENMDEITSRTSSFRVKQCHDSLETSRSGGRSIINGGSQLLCHEWKSTSNMTVGLRSARNRRENYKSTDSRPLDKRKYQPSWRLSWLMLLEHEESYRYIPQQGDVVAYLRQGHEEYVKASRLHEAGPWKSIKSLKAVEFCKVQGLDYSTLPGSGESCCKLALEFIDPSSSGFGKAFKITLPELVAFPDFLVERTRYDAAIERNWTHRDKCQVWWRNEDGDGGSWWEGRILAVKPKSSDFPESPWERYVIQYRNDCSGQHLHSPWELHDGDSQWEHPHIDDMARSKLLSSIAKIEQTSIRNQDCYGIQKLNQVAQKSDFLNRFPVPLSLEVIKRRLENNYYRTLEAVKHDALVMLSNAESYFGRSAEMMMKMRRLSDWITPTFSSL